MMGQESNRLISGRFIRRKESRRRCSMPKMALTGSTKLMRTGRRWQNTRGEQAEIQKEAREGSGSHDRSFTSMKFSLVGSPYFKSQSRSRRFLLLTKHGHTGWSVSSWAPLAAFSLHPRFCSTLNQCVSWRLMLRCVTAEWRLLTARMENRERFSWHYP